LTGNVLPRFDRDVHLRTEDTLELAALVWRFPVPLHAISSAPLGGGVGQRSWVLNAGVHTSYARRDPEVHLAELASEAGLAGPGVGMMTAVDVRHVVRASDGGVTADATVGVSWPVWAAGDERPDGPPEVGTINVVAFVPERLSEAALVNAVGTVTEAKAQALWEAGVYGTGTASDALCILCPASGEPHSFGGPRSRWGARLARTVHRAVLEGCRGGATP
jgi:adenosylcobinamide amidohydrolase